MWSSSKGEDDENGGQRMISSGTSGFAIVYVQSISYNKAAIAFQLCIL